MEIMGFEHIKLIDKKITLICQNSVAGLCQKCVGCDKITSKCVDLFRGILTAERHAAVASATKLIYITTTTTSTILLLYSYYYYCYHVYYTILSYYQLQG
jgi:hypothetical protein